MDLRRNQVRRPFPTPGSGTLWVSGSPCGIGTSLAYPDGRCALPAAPHRTRTAVRAVESALGQAHWPPPQAGATSGRWPTVPGVTHLIACAQVGPIRTPGGPPNPGGRVPHQRPSRALVTPAPPRSLRCWSLPPCFRPQGRPPVPRPLPCPLAPAMSRLPLLSAPALAWWCPLLFVFFLSVPCPPPMSRRCLLAVLALFVGGWRSRGRGGGVLAVRPNAQARRRHGAGTRRGTCPSAGGGACRVAPAVTLPFLLLHPRWTSRWGLHGGAPFGHGRVVRPALSFLCLPTLPRRPRGGGPLPATVIPHVPSSSPRCPRPFPWWVWELGVGRGGRPRCPSSGVSTSQARHWHVARHLSFCWGVGHAAGPLSLPFPLCVRSPGAPPAGACTALASLGHGRVVRPAPSPRGPPFLPLCPREGGTLSAPSFLHPPPLGGRRRVGGWGGACRFPFVALMSQARGAASVPLQGGGVCLVAPIVALSTLHPPSRWSPGHARRVPSSGTVLWFVPLPLPPQPCRVALGGGGRLSPPPYPLSPPSGGRGWVGGGGAPFSSPLRCTHVAGKT